MPEISSPNRPVTPKALRRSWREPQVSVWWLITLGLIVVVAWIVVEQLSVARRGQYRVDHWTRIAAAKIDKIADTTRSTYRVSPDQLSVMPVKMSYVDAAGTAHQLEGQLTAQTEPVNPGQHIPILVDPANPEKWTDRVLPVPLIEEMMAAILFLPLILIFACITLWQRSRILKLWRNGTLREAIVVDRANSATSPRSAIVRCKVESNREQRLLRVAVPRSAARLESGDTISLVTTDGDSSRAIAVMLYE